MPPVKTATKVLVQVRLPEDLVKTIDHLSVEWDLYRAETMERLLREAVATQEQQGSLWTSPKS